MLKHNGYREQHKEQLTIYANKYSQQNKEHIAEYKKQYQAEHADKLKDYHKAYTTKNARKRLQLMVSRSLCVNVVARYQSTT